MMAMKVLSVDKALMFFLEGDSLANVGESVFVEQCTSSQDDVCSSSDMEFKILNDLATTITL